MLCICVGEDKVVVMVVTMNAFNWRVVPPEDHIKRLKFLQVSVKYLHEVNYIVLCATV